MIKHSADMKLEIREHMRDGEGSVEILNLLDKGEYGGKARLIAKITLHEGCSIGEHMHTGEEEIFYIIKGEGVFTDNGEQKPIKTGDVAITRDGQTHSIKNNGTGDLEIVAVILLY